MSEVDDFLEHHGVLGMHWGYRKARPVGPGRQARNTAAVQRLEKRASNAEAQIDKLRPQAERKGVMATYSRLSAKGAIKDLQKAKSQALKDAEAKKNGKLTSTEKKLIIGGAVAGAIVLANTAHLHIESGEATRLIAKGMSMAKGEAFSFAKNSNLTRQMTKEELLHDVVKPINKEFGAMGTTQNCRRCTFAYEMRRRGYDVRATKTTHAEGQNTSGLYNAIHPGEKFMRTTNSADITRTLKETVKEQNAPRGAEPSEWAKLKDNFGAGSRNKIENSNPHAESMSPDDIFNALAKEPNGSRGELGVMWSAGGGHSMAYEIVDGRPIIFDGQTGSMIKHARDFAEHANDVASAGYTRLDNIPLNHDYLMRWVTNVK